MEFQHACFRVFNVSCQIRAKFCFIAWQFSLTIFPLFSLRTISFNSCTLSMNLAFCVYQSEPFSITSLVWCSFRLVRSFSMWVILVASTVILLDSFSILSVSFDSALIINASLSAFVWNASSAANFVSVALSVVLSIVQLCLSRIGE